MYAIGKMTVSWALLEYLLIQMTQELAENLSRTLPPGFVENGTLEKTLKEFKSLLKEMAEPKEIKSYLEKVLKRVDNLKTRRHMLTHGIFSWSGKTPEKIKVRTPKKKKDEHFDAGKIEKLAQEIAGINFEILYPLGEDQHMEELAQRGFAMSRRFAIHATGAKTADLSLSMDRVIKTNPSKFDEVRRNLVKAQGNSDAS